MEVELNLADRAVTVLGDDQVGDVLDLWVVWFVIAGSGCSQGDKRIENA